MDTLPANACYYAPDRWGNHPSGACAGVVTEARGLNPEASCEADLVLASPPLCERHARVFPA
jgi:hypothetical protein